MEGLRPSRWIETIDMEIDVRKVADLARLEISDAEAEEFSGQLGQVITYIEQLESLDVEGIEPTAHAAPVYNIYREDEPQTERFLSQDKALENAPEKAHDQVKMPKVIE